MMIRSPLIEKGYRVDLFYVITLSIERVQNNWKLVHILLHRNDIGGE